MDGRRGIRGEIEHDAVTVLALAVRALGNGGLAGAAAACTVAPIDTTTSTSTAEPSTSTTSTTTSTTSTTTSTTSSTSSTMIPWSPQLVTTETTVALTCGSASFAMSNLVTSDSARFRVEAPDGVLAGSSFDLVIRPYLVEVPTTFACAGINKVNAMRTMYGSPAGATVDAVELESMPGASTVGYYVAPGADRQDPAVRQAIGRVVGARRPIADTLTTVLGGTETLTGSSGEFRKASAVQPPAVRVHLTSTAPAGTDLHLTLGGTVPAAPRQMPWAEPSTSRNLVTNLLIVPANVTQHCGPSAAAAPELSSTVVVELPN